MCCVSLGQARKSLWIETNCKWRNQCQRFGQARKSLWIETPEFLLVPNAYKVRLVRACGSKQVNSVDAVELIGVRLVRACGSKPL